jgi:RNA polymerase sigma-70 factor (ECF subfamily)
MRGLAVNEDVLAALYREHANDVSRYVRRRVPGSDVDDVCQDVWLAAREALPKYENRCPPRVWLRVIARNKIVDLWRRRPEAASTFDSTMSQELGGALKLPTTPSKKLARARASQALARALAAMEEEEREMIALRFLDGLKPAEIAVVLGARPNTVSQRLVRAVRKLRELVEA